MVWQFVHSDAELGVLGRLGHHGAFCILPFNVSVSGSAPRSFSPILYANLFESICFRGEILLKVWLFYFPSYNLDVYTIWG